jgi:hypothetical protein
MQTIALACDWILLVAPIITAESCHAKHCDDHIQLWNNWIVIADPVLFTSIWMALVGVRTLVGISQITVSAIAGNYRIWLLAYMLTVHVLVLYAGLKVCVYSVPLCFTCIEGSMQLLSYCAMDRQ